MRESSLDGHQDLTMFMQEVKEVVREIMGDSRFEGHQHYKFESEYDNEDGEAGGTVVGLGGQCRRCLPDRTN